MIENNENYSYHNNNDYEDQNFYDQDFDEMPHIVVALSGASGFPYGLRLIECLLTMACRVSVIYSNATISVALQECGLELPIINANNRNDVEIAKNTLLMCFQNGVNADLLNVYAENDFFSPIASGSSAADAMVICPCSMGNLAKIAHGISDSLISRAADVMLKERKSLVLVPREMPFSTLHLQNMLELSKIGAVIMPPCPGFYLYPQNIGDMIDFVVSRILEQINLSPKNVSTWSKILVDAEIQNQQTQIKSDFQKLPNQQFLINNENNKVGNKDKKNKYAKNEKNSKTKIKTKTKSKRKNIEVSENVAENIENTENIFTENIAENFAENITEKTNEIVAENFVENFTENINENNKI